MKINITYGIGSATAKLIKDDNVIVSGVGVSSCEAIGNLIVKLSNMKETDIEFSWVPDIVYSNRS